MRKSNIINCSVRNIDVLEPNCLIICWKFLKKNQQNFGKFVIICKTFTINNKIVLIIYIHKVIEIVVPFLWSNIITIMLFIIFLQIITNFPKFCWFFFRNFQHIIKQFGSTRMVQLFL
jgi:hypothetical protein